MHGTKEQNEQCYVFPKVGFLEESKRPFTEVVLTSRPPLAITPCENRTLEVPFGSCIFIAYTGNDRMIRRFDWPRWAVQAFWH